MIRVVATAFGGFNPLDLLDMDLEDLQWWLAQAERLAEEMKNDGG